MASCPFFHTPSNLVVAYWPSEVESTAPLDFLLRHGLWTPFGCPMSCKIRSIISAACDFTTKSDGICNFVLPHASLCQRLLVPEATHGSGSAKVWRPCTPAMAAGL